MDLGLAGKVAVVLASSDGLGFSSARALAREGARVAVCGRDPERLARAAERLELEAPGRILARSLDVTDPVRLREHLREVRDRWGAVQVLVLNAGGPPPGPASAVDRAGLERGLALTLASAVEAVGEVLPGMRRERWGRIVGMTSISVRAPIDDLALSNILRAGLTGYLKTLATEVAAEGVTVNSVCTGMFATSRLEHLFEHRARVRGTDATHERERALARIPAGRFGRPEEFGDLVAFLASERAAYLTGVALAFDGGETRALL